MPITWRQVTGRSNSDAVSLADSAVDTINTGFRSLGTVLDDVRDRNVANQEQRRENNTQDFLDKLATYQTPEALDAATADIAAFRERLGPNIDRETVRNAVSERRTALRNNILATEKFQDSRLQREAAPIEESIRADIIAGNNDAVTKALSDHRDLLQKTGRYDDLLGASDARNQEVFERGLKVDQLNRAEAKRTSSELSDGIVSSVLAAHDDPIEARYAAAEMARRNPNISSEDALAIAGRVNAAWRDEHGISESQQAQLEFVSQQATLNNEADKRRAESVWADVQERNPVSEVFAFTDENRLTEGDVVKTAIDAGWDKDDLANDIKDVKSQFLKQRKQAGVSLTPEDKGNLDTLLHMAVESLGVEDTFLFDGDIPKDDLLEALNGVWDEYQVDAQRRTNLSIGQEAYDNALSAADQRALDTFTQTLNAIKSENRLKRR